LGFTTHCVGVLVGDWNVIIDDDLHPLEDVALQAKVQDVETLPRDLGVCEYFANKLRIMAKPFRCLLDVGQPGPRVVAIPVAEYENSLPSTKTLLAVDFRDALPFDCVIVN
jgi:hypothetical protein